MPALTLDDFMGSSAAPETAAPAAAAPTSRALTLDDFMGSSPAAGSDDGNSLRAMTPEEEAAFLKQNQPPNAKPQTAAAPSAPSDPSTPLPAPKTGVVANAAAGTNEGVTGAIGAPVDAVNWLLGKMGLPVSEAPVMGSRWLRNLEASYGGNPEQIAATTTAEKLARGAGSGVASALLPAGEANALGETGMLGGKALELAQGATGGVDAANAALGAGMGAGSEALNEVTPEPLRPYAQSLAILGLLGSGKIAGKIADASHGMVDAALGPADVPATARNVIMEPLLRNRVDLDALQQKVQAAHDAGVTGYTLADAAQDQFGSLVGTMARKGNEQATNFLQQRQTGTPSQPSQYDRVVGNVQDLLGEGDIDATMQQLAAQHQNVIMPLYERAFQQGEYNPPELAAIATRPGVESALREGAKTAADEGQPLQTTMRGADGQPISPEAHEAFVTGQRGRVDQALFDYFGQGVDEGSLAAAEHVIEQRAAESSPIFDAARDTPIQYNDTLRNLLRGEPDAEGARPRGGGPLMRINAWRDAQYRMGIRGETPDRTNLQTWMYVKQALDRRIADALNRGAGMTPDNDLAAAAQDLKTQLLGELDRQAPDYAQARQVYADHSALLSALRRGQEAARPGYTRERVARDVAGLSPQEAEMYRLGFGNSAREDLSRTMTTNRLPRLVSTNGQLAQKMQMLGRDPAAWDQLQQRLLNENQAFTQAQIPSVRAWHYAAEALDRKAAGEVDKDTGMLSARGNAYVKNRDAILESLRQIPEYAQADALSSPLYEMQQAAIRGKKAFEQNTPYKRVQSDVAALSPAAQDVYRSAASENLTNKLGVADARNKAEMVYGSPNLRNKFAAIMGDGQNAAELTRFATQANAEREMAQLRQSAIGGSATAGRQAADENFDNSDALAKGLKVMTTLGRGHWFGLVKEGIQHLAEKVDPKMRKAVLEEARKIILNPNPQAVSDFLSHVNQVEPTGQMTNRLTTALLRQGIVSTSPTNQEPATSPQ